jgi:nucleoside-diphosphate-sugar epimerase
MNLLLTGASGFVGRNVLLNAPEHWRIFALYCNDESFPAFVSSLRNPGVRAVKCNLGNPAEVQKVMNEHGREWEACLYLAGKVDIPWSVREPQQDLLQNTGALLNLLKEIQAGRFVYFSSGAVYDGLRGEVHPDARIAPTLPYAISKFACERYVEFYRRRQNSIGKFLNVRFFGAYGPYEAPHKIYTRVIRSLIIEKSTSYTIYGDGSNLIDAMYVDDAADAILRMLQGNHWDDTVNLAGGHPTRIDELLSGIVAALDLGSIEIRKEGVAHEKNDFWGSTGEMKQLYNFEPRIGLPEGIRKFAAFLAGKEAIHHG